MSEFSPDYSGAPRECQRCCSPAARIYPANLALTAELQSGQPEQIEQVELRLCGPCAIELGEQLREFVRDKAVGVVQG